ncbi:PQQ-binding-like beta-propeller repeat protein [Cellulomonas sp. McL0617]|uniref:outer membrane protein assembly factor BamB family protein n=1 Tax=Cellulomonas sp. McL0617 TaxID=3415675 RepID=UPI003CE8244E
MKDARKTGKNRFPFTGQQVYVSVDDGSVPDLVLAYDSTVERWSRHDGHLAWSAGVASPTLAEAIRGRIYLTTALGVVGLDGATGTQLWESTGLGVPQALMTDGRHILVSYGGTAESGPGFLVAYDPRTGHEDFRVGLPDGIDQISQDNHTLLGLSNVTGDSVELG